MLGPEGSSGSGGPGIGVCGALEAEVCMAILTREDDKGSCSEVREPSSFRDL